MLNEIDWGKLGNSEIPTLFLEAQSEDSTVRRKALGKLRDTVAPWELLDGYSSTTELMRVAESQIPEMIVPFLIDLLKISQDKDHILETLYELSRYVYVNDSFIPPKKRDTYNDWARHLRELVCEGVDVYKILQYSEAAEVIL